MVFRALFTTVICLCLTGCSYVYDVLAVVQDGRLTFTADEDCVTMVEVRAEGGEVAQPGAGDDRHLTELGTFWYQQTEFADRCKNTFPLAYGKKFEGTLTDRLGAVSAKPLLREVIFTISTSSGSTGYGSGRFIIHSDGSVANLN